MSEQLATINRQADIMSQQMINGQRAWLSSVQAKYDKFQAGERTEATIIFANAGNTPALNVIVKCDMAFRSQPIPEPMAPILQPVASKAIIAPNDTVHIRLSSFEILAEDLIGELNQEKTFLYVWGIVEYDDIFGQHHTTHFCYLNVGKIKLLGYCENNNMAD